MTEKEYRKSDRLSYSAVKLFDTNRIEFHKRYELGIQVETEMSTAMKLGSLIDCKLFSNQEFDDRFVIASCIAPTGQMGDFVEKLCGITIASLDKDLKVSRDLTEMMEEAFNEVKYDKRGVEVAFKKKDFAWLVTNFIGSEAEGYYKECRSQFGKTIVDMNLISASDKIMEELRTCEWTKDIINAKSEGDIEVIDQLGVFYDVGGVPFKGMLDRTIINHKLKTITPYDLKVTYTGEEFQYQYWKMKYYLQVASYFLALSHYSTEIRPELKEYSIPSIEFIVASSDLKSNPLLYSTSSQNVQEGLWGFTTRNDVKYKGLYELVSDIQWHRKEEVWRNSREVYHNKGKMIIKPFEDV